MEDVEQEAGAARPGAHDAPDAVAAHDTIDTTEAHAAKAAATAAPKRPKSVHSPILKWWKEHAALFPYLSQVARRYLAMPATTLFPLHPLKILSWRPQGAGVPSHIVLVRSFRSRAHRNRYHCVIVSAGKQNRGRTLVFIIFIRTVGFG
jgi:hypothetical protein